ncbi:hypothetical protein BKA70DRAFT_1241902 [Coprinopsis sp. MPI-PUGE-AT-0042]|nr:hypothetical protein BKA70DRAFT_1241902 [Coprinopsis sp. MPI-PUGE-AT-0042]
MLLRFSLFLLVLPAISGQNISETKTGSLKASSYIGVLDETTPSQRLSNLRGGSESEVEKVSRALLEPRQGKTCSAGPGGLEGTNDGSSRKPSVALQLAAPLVIDVALDRAAHSRLIVRVAVDVALKLLKPAVEQHAVYQGGEQIVPVHMRPVLTLDVGLSAVHPLHHCAAPLVRYAAHPQALLAVGPAPPAVENHVARPAKHAIRILASIQVALLTSKRVVRFELDEKKNGHLLRNMCNGMRGENTIELTYSGKLSKSAKRRKRSDAGCVRGYCAKLGQPGLNSCDEFPPAMSDEGGGAEPSPGFTRAINCIPGKQNSRQGQRFSTMVRSSKIKAGERFVISIDCDEVLGSIVPRIANSFDAEEGEADLGKRDVIDSSGTSNSALNETTNTLIVDVGDLGAGSYQVEFTVETGSIEAGGFIVDNMGDEIANVTSASSLQTGDTETVSFDIEADGELMGVGLILPTRDTATTISWKFVGEELKPSSSSSTRPPASSDGASDASSALSQNMRRQVMVGWSLSILMTLMLLSKTNTV